MRPLLIPPGYKSVLFWGLVVIVLAVTMGLMWDPGPNPVPN
jgi:uncharacterized membrane protein YgaE (UPF0421/DUF939 family)